MSILISEVIRGEEDTGPGPGSGPGPGPSPVQVPIPVPCAPPYSHPLPHHITEASSSSSSVRPPGIDEPFAEPLLPMQTDVISSEEDDILARGSPGHRLKDRTKHNKTPVKVSSIE